LPRNAARPRIHGGIKARENNVEEARGVLGMLSARGKIPNPSRVSS
jgi:hypothetical protein